MYIMIFILYKRSVEYIDTLPPVVCTTALPAKSWNPLILNQPSLCHVQCAIIGYINPVIMMLYTKYAMKLHLSAKEPETRVAAVAAKTNWKNHFDNLYAEMQY